MHRFFLPLDAFLGDPPVEILLHPGGRDLTHQIHTVLRLSPGETILALDGAGWMYRVVLDRVERKEIRGHILSSAPAGGETRIHVILYASPLRRENYEWVLQKGTELGLKRFVPLLCARTVDRPKSIPERWGRILVEASEQSRRGCVPEISKPMDFTSALVECGRNGVVFHENANQVLTASLLGQPPGDAGASGDHITSLGVFIGPEGGFTTQEIESALQSGLPVVGLGPRVLRAETASITAVTLIMHLLGELRPA